MRGLILVILEAILWGALIALLLLGYSAYYSYKALKYVLRRFYHRLRERPSEASLLLRYDKYANQLEEC